MPKRNLWTLGTPRERTLKLMTYIMGSFSLVTITTVSAPVRPSDLDDEIFLLCAIDGNADYLVSEDRSLTEPKNQLVASASVIAGRVRNWPKHWGRRPRKDSLLSTLEPLY